VALDTACAEACNKMAPLPGTLLAEKTNRTGDIFNDTHPVTHWRSGMEHAQKIGLGTMAYELIEV
ncbi:MAG: 4Fe-4S ferredoxin, partial [Clostridia bacterium]